MSIDKKDILNDIDIVEYWLNKTSTNNDIIKNKTHVLKALLYTLQIHAEKQSDPTAKEIAKQLEHAIKDLRDGTLELVNTGRYKQRSSFNKIKDYINDEE